MTRAPRTLALAALMFCVDLHFAAPASALVLAEDALEETSTELGLMLRTFTFVFTGPTLRPPYNPLESANPSAAAIADLRLSFAYKTPLFSLVAHAQLTPRIFSHASFGGPNLGRGVAPPRWLPLRSTIDGGDRFKIVAGFDWLYARLTLGKVTLKAGRQPITFGRGQLWHPIDLVSMFALTEVDTEYKPGSDALRVDWQIARRSSLTLVAAVGELADDDDAEISWRGTSLLARFQQGSSRGEVALSAGFVRRDVVVGIDGTIDLHFGDLYGEAVLTIPTAKSLTPNTEARCDLAAPHHGCDRAPTSDAVVRAVVGLRFKPLPKLTSSFELFFNGFGTFGAEHYLSTAQSERLAIGEVVGVGALYSGVVLLWEVHPLVKLSGIALVNLGDPSGLLAASISYNIAANVEILGGAYFPAGRVPDISKPPLVTPRSEFGSYPTFFFVEVKAVI